MRHLAIILILFSLKSWGVGRSPKMLRSCINFDDSTVTVQWTVPSDACNSFTHYDLYANVDNGPFNLIATIPVRAVDEYPHKLPDLNTNRKYFIVVHKLCNGVDSAISDTLDIDVEYPANIPIDSVSYDLATQHIIAGWKKNPSADTRGYQIYDFSSGNGDSIGFTNDTFFTITTDPNNVFPVVLASIDSCDLSSILSTPHRVMRLSGTIDTCKREISLSWTPYQGWLSIDSQRVMVSLNRNPYTSYVTIAGNATSHNLPNITLGDTLCIYIRAYTALGTITSSSNYICFETRALRNPTYSYLSQVTVANNQDVDLEWIIDDGHDQKDFTIYRSTDNINFSIQGAVNITNPSTLQYQFTDMSANVDQTIYYYVVETNNVCDELTATTNKSNSILLDFNGPTFKNHNPYSYFDGGTTEYALEKEDPISSTWNTVNVQSTGFNTTSFDDSIGCYRVRAIEGMNQYGFSRTSVSNEVCIGNLLNYFIPNAIHTSTENNRFLIVANGIDHNISYYEIFNRWGELIVRRPTNEAWYAEYRNELVPQGVYLCLVYLYGYDGEQEMIKQPIYVFR